MIKFLLNPLSGSFDAVTTVTATAVGSTPNANAISIGTDGASLTLQPADATHPGVVTIAAQTFAGNKTFSNSVLTSVIDTASAGGTLALGTSNATTINIGNAGSTVNIQGTVITETSTTLNVTNPVFTVNFGAGVGSASNSGMQVNENNVITGYVETSADRNSWILKAPNTAGIATITPGAGGITLNQSSHNPVTIGTANGLSLSTQVLSLGLASTSTTGALSNTDWNTFSNKQPAGNYITALTGDVSASGPGSATATVNSVGGSSAATIHTAEIAANGASVALASNAIVLRDVNGSFAAGVITVDNVIDNGLTANTALIADGSKQLKSSVTTSTELGFVSGVTSSIQTQLNAKTTASTGDIGQTSFTAANNQASATNVTGLAFANASVGGFTAFVRVALLATTSLYEYVELQGIQKGSTWEMTSKSTGDVSGILFTITTAGQIQYTSPNASGFTSLTFKFRALAVTV